MSPSTHQQTKRRSRPCTRGVPASRALTEFFGHARPCSSVSGCLFSKIAVQDQRTTSQMQAQVSISGLAFFRTADLGQQVMYSLVSLVLPSARGQCRERISRLLPSWYSAASP